MANSRQGEFPWQNLKLDGFEGTSPDHGRRARMTKLGHAERLLQTRVSTCKWNLVTH
jgi:hypothetical protein